MNTPLRLCAILALLVCSLSIVAQPPAPANPLAPTLAPINPTGAQRGTTIDLTLTGTNLTDPTGIWTSFPAKVTIPTEANNGKVPTSLKVKLEIPKDAPMGFHSVRVATKRGMSNARLFCVDDLPQVIEVANNRDTKTAQALTAPCVVVARADTEATDYFKVSVKAKERLSFEVIGRRLGNTFDPQISLRDADGKELPGAFSNDAPGLQTDCRITHTFEKAGDVYVTVRDVSYRGGADFNYRLRVGDFPCATTPLPLAVKRGTKTAVKFAGPTVEGVAAVEVQAPTDLAIESIEVAPKGTNGLHGWPVVLHLSDMDETLEKEPNNDAKQATRIEVPSGVTGRFEQKDDIDHYVFKAQKGKRYIIEAHTTEHLSPSEVYVVLKNDKGAQILASNPMATPRLDFTATADGDFTIAVEHLHSWGGPDEVYRLTVTPYAPTFGLTLNIDRWDVAPGGTVSIPIFATKVGYAGPIEVNAIGAKGVSGTVTIPAGAPKPPAQPSATLAIKVDDLPAGPISFAIQGKATIDGKVVTVLASVRVLLTTGMANLSVPPKAMTTQLGLAITEKAPFSMALKFGAPTVAPGGAIEATVSIARQPGFVGEVVVAFQGLPPGAKLEPAAVKIAGNQNEAKVKITLPTNAKLVPVPVNAVGASKHSGRDWSVRSDAAQLLVKK